MPNVVVSVMQRPPISPVASSTTNVRPRDAASRRAAAIPAAPAPTTTISTVARPRRFLPDAAGVGAGVCRGAPNAGPAPKAAEAARNDRRVRRFIGSGCWGYGRRHHAGMRCSGNSFGATSGEVSAICAIKMDRSVSRSGACGLVSLGRHRYLCRRCAEDHDARRRRQGAVPDAVAAVPGGPAEIGRACARADRR